MFITLTKLCYNGAGYNEKQLTINTDNIIKLEGDYLYLRDEEEGIKIKESHEDFKVLINDY